MRILIITDAWFPQINGVVQTLNAVARELRGSGHDVRFITPEGRFSLPMPYYPEIRLTRTSARSLAREIRAMAPDAIHIATEGPLGWAARRACLKLKWPFTTSFHTRFAEYATARIPLPGVSALSWLFLKHCHAKSAAVLAPTPTMQSILQEHGFHNVKCWTHGVDRSIFKQGPRDTLAYPRPILLFAGRLAVEKNIEAFLDLDVAGTKMLVGDGPDRKRLEARYPQAVFLGYRKGEALAECYAAADVLVFPSRTDTFGLVMIEAMACGTPVAAYNIPSPIDVVENGVTGALDANLKAAITRALTLDRTIVEQASRKYSWQRAANIFYGWLAPIPK